MLNIDYLIKYKYNEKSDILDILKKSQHNYHDIIKFYSSKFDSYSSDE